MISGKRLLDIIIAAYKFVGAVVVGLMMVHITADVIGKFVFDRPLPGTIPIVSKFYMVIIAFLPLAIVERESGHIDVEVLTNQFSRTVQKFLYFFSTLLGIAVYGALTWRTWLEAMKKYGIGTFSYEEGIKIITWPSYFILPFGIALTVVVLIAKLRWTLTDQRNEISDQQYD